jgi:hypothetical protein
VKTTSKRLLLIFLIFSLLWTGNLRANEHHPSDSARRKEVSNPAILKILNDCYPNIPFWTLGGKQYWADVFIYGGWRIQKNIFSGHFRLLDTEDIRRGWGDYKHCRDLFENKRQEKNITLKSPHMVIVVHGILRSKDMLSKMVNRLQKAGYEARAINYPSTRGTIADHARRLELLISRLEDVDTLSLVTHSMGGIIVRKMFDENYSWPASINRGRLVMIAPPNHGSEVAKRLDDIPLYGLITGKSGRELKTDKIKSLPIPELEFGIIAGKVDGGINFRHLISEENDGTVSVNTTRLEKATDFILLKGSHNSLPRQDDVIDKTINFLKTGSF